MVRESFTSVWYLVKSGYLCFHCWGKRQMLQTKFPAREISSKHCRTKFLNGCQGCHLNTQDGCTLHRYLESLWKWYLSIKAHDRRAGNQNCTQSIHIRCEEVKLDSTAHANREWVETKSTRKENRFLFKSETLKMTAVQSICKWVVRNNETNRIN